MNVTVVGSYNSEIGYTIKLDTKLMSELRIFLGTKFDKLVTKKEKSRIKFNDYEIRVNIEEIENALKERLKELSKHVQEKENGTQNEKSFLNLLFDTKVLDINTVTEKPRAILDHVHERKNVGIPFDLIFYDFINQIKNGTVILKKRHNKKIFEEKHNMIINVNSICHPYLTELEELFKNSTFLSEKIKHSYYHMEKLICKGMIEVKNNSQSPLTRTGKVYFTSMDGTLWFKTFGIGENINVKIFETETNIKLKAKIPMAIVELIEEVKIEREELLKDGEMLRKYDNFIVELKERWFRSIFYVLFDQLYKSIDKKKLIIKLSKKNEGEACTSNNIKTIQDKQEEHVLYFDKNSLIGKTFLLKIYGKENAVKLVKGKKDSAIFVNINNENKNEISKGKLRMNKRNNLWGTFYFS
ncbi:unnamed protein product [Meloidogyne enterolobii]|uniref:Uncharacterized protein n=1 Tax=Meloidogyne enterolobii TaxID=390850 RepID=A0ACB1AJL2_MELEN